ncbi:MAG: divalent-cation tolerance protein CutA [Nannocystaceae bacterium]|nr:divalent-cation tolerance protein CutA [bacterium]
MRSDTAPDALCVLFVTIDAAHAAAFARSAVQTRLVACANLLPGARSVYWWQGELCEDDEVLVWMETRAQDVERRIAALAELHPYDTPKIIALPPSAVHPAYRRWCLTETEPKTEPA